MNTAQDGVKLLLLMSWHNIHALVVYHVQVKIRKFHT
jgi:hypothetical protein